MFSEPEFDEVDYSLHEVIKNCRKKIFHTFEYRCVYDIKLTNITKSEEVVLPISLGYMEFKPEYY